MLRSLLSIALLATPAAAFAQALPVMSEGYSVEVYAAVPDAVKLSIAPDGTLYAGRDLSSGSGSGTATRIHRVTPGDPPIVSEFGDTIEDPDAVFVDVEGIYAPEPGDVLVGGRIIALNPFAGYIAAIAADDGATTTLVPANQTVQNPVGFAFDTADTLWVASFDNRLLVPITGSGLGATILLADEPLDLAIEPGTDRLFVSLQNGAIQIWEDGVVVDPAFTTGRALAFAPGTNGFDSDAYVVNPANGTLSRVDSGGNATAIGTGFGNDGFGLAFGPDGRLYVSDFDNDRILVVPENANATAALAAVALLMWRRGDQRPRVSRPTSM